MAYGSLSLLSIQNFLRRPKSTEEILKRIYRNAVLPQPSTWINQVGALASGLKFPGTGLVYCRRHSSAPVEKKYRS
ncbi:MAG: hypothetical protein RLZZ597_880 [Cyanobacteriota bacterium]|jgi:hypothetical protein